MLLRYPQVLKHGTSPSPEWSRSFTHILPCLILCAGPPNSEPNYCASALRKWTSSCRTPLLPRSSSGLVGFGPSLSKHKTLLARLRIRTEDDTSRGPPTLNMERLTQSKTTKGKLTWYSYAFFSTITKVKDVALTFALVHSEIASPRRCCAQNKYKCFRLF